MDTSCKRFGVPIFACNSCVWNHWRYTSCSNPFVADAVAWVFSSCLISCRPSCSSPMFWRYLSPFGCIWLFSFSPVILGTCCSCTSKTFKRNKHQFEVHSTFWCLLPSLKLILSNQHVHPSHPLPTNTDETLRRPRAGDDLGHALRLFTFKWSVVECSQFDTLPETNNP